MRSHKSRVVSRTTIDADRDGGPMASPSRFMESPAWPAHTTYPRANELRLHACGFATHRRHIRCPKHGGPRGPVRRPAGPCHPASRSGRREQTQRRRRTGPRDTNRRRHLRRKSRTAPSPRATTAVGRTWSDAGTRASPGPHVPAVLPPWRAMTPSACPRARSEWRRSHAQRLNRARRPAGERKAPLSRPGRSLVADSAGRPGLRGRARATRPARRRPRKHSLGARRKKGSASTSYLLRG